MDTEKLSALLSPDPPTIIAVPVTGSTNTDARAYVTAHHPLSPVLFTADRQTSGRGRQGKSFLSPAGGLYMTLALPTGREAAELIGSTSCAAAAAIRAIRSVSGAPCGIKWVNDLYLGGGKLGGILTESVNEGTRSLYLLIGIGINLTEAPDVTDSSVPAASLAGYDCPPESLCAALVRELLGQYAAGFDFARCADEYRSCSLVIGRPITFRENGILRRGIAVSVEDDGALRVRLTDGDVLLRGGEITVRLDETAPEVPT